MILKDEELNNIYGGSLRDILLIGLGSIISFVAGVFGSFFSKDC